MSMGEPVCDSFDTSLFFDDGGGAGFINYSLTQNTVSIPTSTWGYKRSNSPSENNDGNSKK